MLAVLFAAERMARNPGSVGSLIQQAEEIPALLRAGMRDMALEAMGYEEVS
jgi:hypothetical protein